MHRDSTHHLAPPIVRRRLLLIACALALAGAPATGPLAAEDPAAPGVAEGSARPASDVMRKWSRSCALCHVDGNGGAPRVGRADEWQPRLAKGGDVLYEHTVKGFNKMPPLGYCMSCEAEDFRALIDFMTGAPE